MIAQLIARVDDLILDLAFAAGTSPVDAEHLGDAWRIRQAERHFQSSENVQVDIARMLGLDYASTGPMDLLHAIALLQVDTMELETFAAMDDEERTMYDHGVGYDDLPSVHAFWMRYRDWLWDTWTPAMLMYAGPSYG